MLVVSDATPIISFVKMDKLDILQKLFGEVVLPKAVYDEVTSNPQFVDEARKIRACSFFKVVTVSSNETVNLLNNHRHISDAILIRFISGLV